MCIAQDMPSILIFIIRLTGPGNVRALFGLLGLSMRQARVKYMLPLGSCVHECTLLV
jgi:hypothetical protein